jgi:hypothetical protein
MIRFLLISLIISSVFGGCGKVEQVVNSTSANLAGQSIEQMVLEHVKQNFSLSSSDVTVKTIKPEHLPENFSQVYVEKKSSYGNIFYNYLVGDNKLYCSGVTEDFGRFLQDQNFLNKKNLTTEQFLQAFRILRFKRRDVNILNEDTLSKPNDQLKPFVSLLSAPKLMVENGRATLVFFTKKVAAAQLEKWEIKVSPNYEVTVENTVINK